MLRLLAVINGLLIFKHPEGHTRNSNFIKYSTLDGINIQFETFRHIQCKRLVLYEFIYSFKWTGNIRPEIKSSLQNVVSVNSKQEGEWDSATLRFKKPLLYNETAIIHFLAEMNDADQNSSPHVETRIELPVDIILFRIELRHKKGSFDKPATLKRKKITADINSNYEILKTIPFDRNYKGYEYTLLTPESNYYYRIEWEK